MCGMGAVGSFFIDHPWRAAVIGVIFVLAFIVVLMRSGRPSSAGGWAIGVTAVLWLLYAAWEWGIQRNSPDANIRIDLLLIYPILAIMSVISIIQLFRGGRA